MNVVRIGTAELAELLEAGKKNNQKMAIILGSRTGALFRGQKLTKEMNFSGMPSLVDMKETEKFSACYSWLKMRKKKAGGEDLGIFLKQQINEIDFSMVDEFMANLIKQGIFRVILNSNIDDMLYRALIDAELKENEDFINFDISNSIIAESDIADSFEEFIHYPKSKACKIINLYNDVDTFVHNLDIPDVQANIGRYVKKLLDEMKINEVFVVGMDLMWDHIILSALPSRVKLVLFVNEDKQVKETFCSTYQKIEQCSFIIGEQWGYEKLLRALYFQINPDSLPGRHESIMKVQDQLNVMRRNLTSIKDGLTNLETGVTRMQRQITGLSRRVEEVTKHNLSEGE